MRDWRPRIIDVIRKPRKCPVCGGRVVDIIYGTGDMTELEYLLKYRQDGIMGGDDIPRRPPIWACAAGCKRFRKVNIDGSDAEVKVKMLKNVRKKPMTLINITTKLASEAFQREGRNAIHHYHVRIKTELGEKETFSITAVTETDAIEEVRDLVFSGRYGLRGEECVKVEVDVKDEV